MADINHLILGGRLVADTEVRMTKSGKKITTFSIAVNDDYKTDEWVKRSYFFNVIYLGEKNLNKGDIVMLEGKITQKKQEKEGQPKYYFQIVADKVVPYQSYKKEEKPNSEYVTDEVTEDISIPF